MTDALGNNPAHRDAIGDQRNDQRTDGGQHLQTPSKAAQVAAAEDATRTLDLNDQWQIRRACLELQVAEEELRQAVMAVGSKWTDIRAYIQRPAAAPLAPPAEPSIRERSVRRSLLDLARDTPLTAIGAGIAIGLLISRFTR